ncbi:hypothetical protein SS50377_23164 [Spironucleus salmonicida]|uniref:Uncharacterized protein n=1 Tax=Spironucleus salmonicida TaxID=348837 RepID=V6LDC9_9EUKA|nr:hypothetical protein SS50377_23164 [Spironucleus salmonicida]|eukprot:EST41661.1 Hypothetical protein SS50377_18749 [Spironucleus salmonicida]
MDFNLNDILSSLNMKNLCLDNLKDSRQELIYDKESTQLTTEVLQNIGINIQEQGELQAKITHSQKDQQQNQSLSQNQQRQQAKPSKFQTNLIYRNSSKLQSPILPVKTQANVRNQVKNSEIMQQFQRKQQNETRFQEIRDQVRQEMEAKKLIEESKLKQLKLIENSKFQNSKFLEITQKQAKKQIEEAQQRERDAKCQILIINEDLKRKVKCMTIIKNKYFLLKHNSEKIIYKHNARLQRKIMNYIVESIKNVNLQKEIQMQKVKQDQQTKLYLDAIQMQNFYLQKKLFKLFLRLGRVKRSQQRISSEQQERIDKIDKFMSKFENLDSVLESNVKQQADIQKEVEILKTQKTVKLTQKLNIPQQKNIQQSTIKQEEQPNLIETIINDPNQSKCQQHSKEIIKPVTKLKPYKAPQKPQYLLQMEEREQKRKLIKEQKQQLEKDKKKQSEEKMELEKIQQKQTIIDNQYKAECHYGYQYLIIYPLSLWRKKFVQLQMIEKNVINKNKYNLLKNTFSQTIQLNKNQKINQNQLTTILLTNFNKCILSYQSLLVLNIFKKNLYLSQLNIIKAQSTANSCVLKKYFYLVYNAYRNAESDHIQASIPQRNLVLLKASIFTWKRSIQLLKRRIKAEQYAERQIQKLEFNMVQFENIIDRNFNRVWDNKHPLEKTFHNLCDTILEDEQIFIQNLKNFGQQAIFELDIIYL